MEQMRLNNPIFKVHKIVPLYLRFNFGCGPTLTDNLMSILILREGTHVHNLLFATHGHTGTKSTNKTCCGQQMGRVETSPMALNKHFNIHQKWNQFNQMELLPRREAC